MHRNQTPWFKRNPSYARKELHLSLWGQRRVFLRSDPDRISYQIEFLILLYCSAVASGSAGTLREHRALLLIISHHGEIHAWEERGGTGGRGQLQHVGLIWAHNARSRDQTSLLPGERTEQHGPALGFGHINGGGRERSGKTRRFSVRRTETAAAAATDRAAGGDCACARACVCVCVCVCVLVRARSSVKPKDTRDIIVCLFRIEQNWS